MKRLILILLLLFILSGCTTQPSQPGEGKEIVMGQPTWDTGWFQAQVYKLLLEELGYTVEKPITLENPEFYIASALGYVDFWANGWFPLHELYFEYENVQGKLDVIGYLVKAGAIQGYLIDKTVAVDLGITNLADFQDPEIAKVFDRDGDGRADLIGCDDGWGCAKVIDRHLEVNGLTNTVEHLQSGYTEQMVGILAEYEPGMPILFYTWTPNWTVSEFQIGEDVAWLSVPDASVSGGNTPANSIDGCLETPCDMGFGVNDIRVVANIDFLTENPSAAMLFELVKIPLKDIAQQNIKMFLGENSSEDIQRHAKAWIEENQAAVDAWLDQARSAAE
ncbi:MAG: glycine betaine/L-proline ABC transporter substrate-binding protein ProX [Anaerolineae bacterium]|nr:glycine betaine/L-proline ABC transporter substrate-binding protein ProX [Anaerolineae bacterium]